MRHCKPKIWVDTVTKVDRSSEKEVEIDVVFLACLTLQFMSGPLALNGLTLCLANLIRVFAVRRVFDFDLVNGPFNPYSYAKFKFWFY